MNVKVKMRQRRNKLKFALLDRYLMGLVQSGTVLNIQPTPIQEVSSPTTFFHAAEFIRPDRTALAR
jgi:hypothetical protein